MKVIEVGKKCTVCERGYLKKAQYKHEMKTVYECNTCYSKFLDVETHGTDIETADLENLCNSGLLEEKENAEGKKTLQISEEGKSVVENMKMYNRS